MKVLIVDDEPLTRKGIYSMIKKSDLEPEAILEAGSGGEAIEISYQEQPEIIIMDIKMPGIDGIAAAKEIKKTFQRSKIIFLTAYSYFDYAREAVRCRASDYLIKPVNHQNLISILRNCMEEVKQEDNENHMKEQLEENLFTAGSTLEEYLVRELVEGKIYSTEHLFSHLKVLTPLIEKPWFNEFKLPDTCIIIDVGMEIAGCREDQIKNILIQETGAPFLADFIDNTIVLLACINEQNNAAAVKFAEEALNAVLYVTCDSAILQAGIGRTYTDLQYLSQSYAEALKALDYNINKSTEPVKGNYSLVHIDNIDENKLYSRPYKIAQQAANFIKENYHQKLTLEEVAKEVCIHPAYLSSILKEQIGYTFSSYVNILKIEKAKELLTEELSIKEVAYKAGYDDNNYFSRVFKKITGVSPKTYRQYKTHSTIDKLQSVTDKYS